MAIKSVFVCPRCQTGLNTDGPRPSECPACGHKFSPESATPHFRMPRSLFDQWRDLFKKRVAEIPPMKFAPDTDPAVVQAEKAKHVAAQSQRVEKESLKELVEFILSYDDKTIVEMMSVVEFVVEHLGIYERPALLHMLGAKAANIVALRDNIMQGMKLKVRYGDPATRPDSSGGSVPST